MKNLDSVNLDELNNLLESTIVPDTNYCLSDYAYGRCHLFAYALHLTYNYDIELFLDFNYTSENYQLVHAYCIHPKSGYIDCRGIISMEVIESEYDFNDKIYRKVKLNDLLQMIASNYLCDFEWNELQALLNFIENNRKKYE